MKRAHLCDTWVLAVALGLLTSACEEHESVPERAARKSRNDPVEQARKDEVSIVSSDDPHMAKAYAKARATLDEFLAAAANPAPGTEGPALKVAIRDGDLTEYFWVGPFEVDGEGFSGLLDNAPRLVTRVRQGERIRFAREDIVDWMYLDTAAGRMQGNFTACALLKHESAADAARFREEFGLECED